MCVSGSSPDGGESILTPSLAVMRRVVLASPSARAYVRRIIFPKPYVPRTKEEEEEEEEEDDGEEEEEHAEGQWIRAGQTLAEQRARKEQMKKLKEQQKKMKADDAPAGSLRTWLIEIMRTGQSPIVRRFSGEMLYAVCGENPNEFLKRAGKFCVIRLPTRRHPN